MSEKFSPEGGLEIKPPNSTIETKEHFNFPGQRDYILESLSLEELTRLASGLEETVEDPSGVVNKAQDMRLRQIYDEIERRRRREQK